MVFGRLVLFLYRLIVYVFELWEVGKKIYSLTVGVLFGKIYFNVKYSVLFWKSLINEIKNVF